jgi:hypothetical protein
MPYLNGVGATSACLHDLPTPAEARASRRRERFGEGRSPFKKGGYIVIPPSTAIIWPVT